MGGGKHSISNFLWKKKNKQTKHWLNILKQPAIKSMTGSLSMAINTGGALLKMWQVCAATLTPILKHPTPWMTLFLFFTFCSHLMTPIFKMLSLNDMILRNKMLSLVFFLRNALTEWPPLDMYPIFVWKEGFIVTGRLPFCTKIESLTKWPPFS